MPNILFISYDGMTDPLGQSQVIPYLAGLSKHGYKITILSCEKPKRYSKFKNDIESILKPLSVKWSPVLYHKNPPVLSTIYDVMALKKRARKLYMNEKFEMVHTRPGIPALVGLWMKQKWGIKFLNDIREFYADSRAEGGIWNTNLFIYKVIYNFFKEKEKEAVVKSDGIVCLTHAAHKIISSWDEFNNQFPIRVIPCSVDVNLFDPERIDPEHKHRLEKELNIKEGDFIISYLGSIGSWYLTDELIRLFKEIIIKVPQSKILFISPDEHLTISKACKKFDLPEQAIIVKNAKRNEVPVLLSFSKFSAFFIKRCYSKQSSSPTKHGEIMAMGIPVITNYGVGDVADIVKKYNSGIVLKELNTNEFQSAAKSIAEGINFDKNIIREGAVEYYNLYNAIETYNEIYSIILNKSA